MTTNENQNSDAEGRSDSEALLACRWSGRHLYKTGCGEQFYDASETGAPVTDWMSYCPYCGQPVTLKAS